MTILTLKIAGGVILGLIAAGIYIVPILRRSFNGGTPTVIVGNTEKNDDTETIKLIEELIYKLKAQNASRAHLEYLAKTLLPEMILGERSTFNNTDNSGNSTISTLGQ